MKRFFTLLLLPVCSIASAQKLDTLTIEKIMRDPKWICVSPSEIRWADDSKKLYFSWNPDKSDRSVLYSITPADTKPTKVSIDDQKALPSPYGEWNKKQTLKVYEKNGDIFISSNLKQAKYSS